MSRMKLRFLVFALFATIVGLQDDTWAESFPDDSGVINVRAFGALGNGHNDDTAAILRAIAASGEDNGDRLFWHDRIVYLPRGTYLVSGTLLKRYATGQFGAGLILIGESQSSTMIRLVDHADGFDNPNRNRAVIFTTSKLASGSPTAGGKDYVGRGEGDGAYMNFVEDLSIDVGHGNPGAVAIDFLGNNVDAIRNVTLRAADDSGAIALSMTRKWPGPTLVQNLRVDGFNIGIRVAQSTHGITFDHLRLKGQRVTAISNTDNVLILRDAEISGVAPLVRNEGARSFLALDGGALVAMTGPADLTSAIANFGIVRVRNLQVDAPNWDQHRQTGLLQGVLSGQADWDKFPQHAWLPPSADSLVPLRTSRDHWTNAAHYGAVNDPTQDSTSGLRQALASGFPVVYLPHGIYAISDTVDVPPTVQRIVGMNSVIKPLPGRQFPPGAPFFRVGSGGPPIAIDRLNFDNTGQQARAAVEVSGARDVTVQDSVALDLTLIDRQANGGRTFLENVCCGKLQLAGIRPIFARQLTTEGPGVRIVNMGSPLWILGLSTSGSGTVIENRQGAHTDVFGGLIDAARDDHGEGAPAFNNRNSWLSASFVEQPRRNGSRYRVYVAQESSLGRKSVDASIFPPRGLGRFVAALVETPGDTGSQ